MRHRLTKQRVFSTRERAAEIRSEIEACLHQADEQEPLVLDFADVELVSFSFADELVGRLLSDRRAGSLGEHPIFIANANDDVLAPIGRSLERRGLIGASLDDGRVRLLGAPDHIHSTFDAARRRAEFRASELAADLGITASACNNRLKPLLAAGVLLRTPCIPRSGGREFVYRVSEPPAETRPEVA